MPEQLDAVGLPVVLVLGAAFLAWYFAGNELMRRRARRLALWTKRVVDPAGGRQSVRWLSQQAFRLEVEEAGSPFRSLQVTGLVESWDVPMVWLWNRLRGRRDMVLLQVCLRQPPRWGFEVYRPGSVLAGDARHFARQEGWPEAPLDDLVVAADNDGPRRLAVELVGLLEAERWRLVRLALRRRGTHLTLALNVPDPAALDPARLASLTRRLADRAASP
jgi:hypothetical protein